MIRVGRRQYSKNGSFTDPSFEGFTPIIVMTYSYKDWYELSPYALKNNKDQILENIWQFSKVYKNVPNYTAFYSRYNKKIIWTHNAETHIDNNGNLTDKYWKWRSKGMNTSNAIRYPVGFKHRHECVYAIEEEKTDYSKISKKLNYIESRKKIYVPLYISLAKKQSKFTKLKKMLNDNNLLIIEVDGPHEESMNYYKQKYNVSDNFITDSTILVNKKNMNILLNDKKHAFGHGYCLGMALLNIDYTKN
jgi:hypothetical protein